jgi:hypothetical protein
MINHFHSATLTPQANLASGMQWWQSTFAKRFNNYRQEHGHLFQGRYKGILVDPETRLGPLCDYIHLNPVKAKVVTIDELPNYPWTSIYWMAHPNRRPTWYDPRPALAHAGNLPDTPDGRRKYLEYLRWLAGDNEAQKKLRFDLMERGWAMGSPEFLQDLVTRNSHAVDRSLEGEDDTRIALHAAWTKQVQVFLGSMGKNVDDAAKARKSEPWKLAIAAAMKTTSTATNRWLAAYLRMGTLHEASRNVSAWQKKPDPELGKWLRRQITHHKA